MSKCAFYKAHISHGAIVVLTIKNHFKCARYWRRKNTRGEIDVGVVNMRSCAQTNRGGGGGCVSNNFTMAIPCETF